MSSQAVLSPSNTSLHTASTNAGLPSRTTDSGRLPSASAGRFQYVCCSHVVWRTALHMLEAITNAEAAKSVQ